MYYAVCSEHASESSKEDPIWTVSKNPDEEGWETDMGANGYGLMKSEAEWLAAAGNEKLAREGKLDGYGNGRQTLD